MQHRIATAYTHTQDTPSATWTIVHGLNDYPIVDVFVQYNGALNKIIPQGISYVDAKTCTVQFSTAYAGYATVV
jgi:hypothetical protein